jgi:hypothetical protein
LEVFLNISVRFACFIDTYFSGKKQNFRSWDYFPHVPDHQDFHIIRCQNVKLDWQEFCCMCTICYGAILDWYLKSLTSCYPAYNMS